MPARSMRYCAGAAHADLDEAGGERLVGVALYGAPRAAGREHQAAIGHAAGFAHQAIDELGPRGDGGSPLVRIEDLLRDPGERHHKASSFRWKSARQFGFSATQARSQAAAAGSTISPKSVAMWRSRMSCTRGSRRAISGKARATLMWP